MDVGQLQLEERICSGGCGKKFRCLPTSTATTARGDCAYVCKKEPLTVEAQKLRQNGLLAEPRHRAERRAEAKVRGLAIVAAAEGRPPAPPPPPPPKKPKVPYQGTMAHPEGTAPSGDERMTVWLQCIDEAKAEVAKMHAARARIVDLCLRACDIRWGGGAHWSGHEGVYTARRFAKEIGVNYKTLMNWLTARRLVADQLEPGEWKEEDFRFAQRAIKRSGAQAPRQKVLDEFRRQRDGAKTKYKLGSIVEWSRSHRNFIKASDVSELPRDDLLALRALCADTVALIDAKLREIDK